MATKKITRAIANILADKIKLRLNKHYKDTCVPKEKVQAKIEASQQYKEYKLALAAVEAAQDFANEKRDVVADFCATMQETAGYSIQIHHLGGISIYFKSISSQSIADELILNSFLADDDLTADELVESYFTAFIS